MKTNNIKEVEISIKKQLDSLNQSPSDPYIRKIPKNLAKLSTCYKPSIVSIGPLHYNTEPALTSFHEMKVKHLQCFLKVGNQNYGLDEYIAIVRGQENQIRSCYSEKSSLSSNKFIEMILIDAAFIIIFFMFNNGKNFPIIKRHPITERSEVLLMVKQDIFLVDNQLPFFILNILYYKAFGDANQNTTTFVDVITYSYLKCSSSLTRDVADTKTCEERIRNATNVKHLVDLLRICCLPTKLRENNVSNHSSTSEYPKSTVKELKAAGVKFRASGSQNLLDITFSKGVLQIPKVRIQHTTEHVLRSIVFLEQCHHLNDSYIIFMDGLIDTPEDVQILVQNGIMNNMLGSDEEVAILFNKITKGVACYDRFFYYGHQSSELNAYADARWNRWKAVLKRDYFNHPWSIISIIYLLVLLILTVLQVYTGFMG